MIDVDEREMNRGSWRGVRHVRHAGCGKPKGMARIRAVAKGKDIRIAKRDLTACPQLWTGSAT